MVRGTGKFHRRQVKLLRGRFFPLKVLHCLVLRNWTGIARVQGWILGIQWRFSEIFCEWQVGRRPCLRQDEDRLARCSASSGIPAPSSGLPNAVTRFQSSNPEQINLTESSGWLLESSKRAPTKQEFKNVLSKLSGIWYFPSSFLSFF